MAAAVAAADLAEVLMEAVSAAVSREDLPVVRGLVALEIWEWAEVLCPWADGIADAAMAVDAVA